MSKYIDSNEARRLNRLKHVKSSIGGSMGHNGWQKQQIEKRRREQLRQRRRAAKKKPLGDGIRVDTKVSKSDAISKCGLKLKVQQDADGGNKARARKEASGPPREASHKTGPGLPLNRRRYNPTKQTDGSNASDDRAAMKRNSIQKPKPAKQAPRKHVSNTRFRGDDGKENSDNSANNKRPRVSKEAPRADAAPRRVPPSKKYFMDIDSLRREHADAIRMLEELDKCEGEKRRSLGSSEGNSFDLRSFDLGYDGRGGGPGQSPAHHASKPLDGDLEEDCSDSLGAREELGALEREGPHGVTESFLNMTHLSISLRDDFEDTRGDYFYEDDESEAVTPLTPAKNGSFAFETCPSGCPEGADCDKNEEMAPLNPAETGSFAFDDSRDSSFEGDDDEAPLTPEKNGSFSFETCQGGCSEGADCDKDRVAFLAPAKTGSFASNSDRDNSFEGDDKEGNGATPRTPLVKNRSFTSSCASIEESDFFGDADCDSCSSEEEGYSSGTF